MLIVLTFVCGALHAASPTTLNNDDSCDISVAPAATLLLPYFEVDLNNPARETTLFSITNVGPLPQIARVTIWTDWAYPVLTFNIFLTGYDVQSINLYDILARGPNATPGTTSASEVGLRSAENDMNPMHDVTLCGIVLDPLPPPVLADLRRALTLGRTAACAGARVGSTHGNAVGYATVDVVQNCGSKMPVDAGYFTEEILYDNVLIGDYQQVNGLNSFAQGNTLVHIRAIPEGGLSGWAGTNFRRTFYSRLQNGGTADRRQPLPATFAARWRGTVPGYGTSFKVWREGTTAAAAGCSVAENGDIHYPDVVRFDEDENPAALLYNCEFLVCGTYGSPAVMRMSEGDGNQLPPNAGHAEAGWMYFNLDNHGRQEQPRTGIATQNWIVVSTYDEGRYSADFDASFLGNGCSATTRITSEHGDAPAIGPAPNVNP
jgi:hypothetical protein